MPSDDALKRTHGQERVIIHAADLYLLVITTLNLKPGSTLIPLAARHNGRMTLLSRTKLSAQQSLASG